MPIPIPMPLDYTAGPTPRRRSHWGTTSLVSALAALLFVINLEHVFNWLPFLKDFALYIALGLVMVAIVTGFISIILRRPGWIFGVLGILISTVMLLFVGFLWAIIHTAVSALLG